MCIRDSDNEARLIAGVDRGGLRLLGDDDVRAVDDHRVACTVVARVALVTGTCLLYTSDAADERSSVDLGGRRIIKKKNREAKRIGITQ